MSSGIGSQTPLTPIDNSDHNDLTNFLRKFFPKLVVKGNLTYTSLLSLDGFALEAN